MVVVTIWLHIDAKRKMTGLWIARCPCPIQLDCYVVKPQHVWNVLYCIKHGEYVGDNRGMEQTFLIP